MSYATTAALSSATWTATNLNPSSGTGNVAYVKGVSSGTAKITFTFPTDCGNRTVFKNITVGSSSITGTYTTGTYTSTLSYVQGVSAGRTTANVTLPGASSFNWSLQSGNAASWYTYNGGQDLDLTLNYGQYAVFVVSATNSCGTTTSSTFRFAANSGSTMAAYEVYPNPANSELIISTQSKNMGADQNQSVQINNEFSGDFTVELYDRFGQLIKTMNSSKQSPSLQLDLKGVRPGQYILRIKDQKQTLGRQILIER